MPAFGAVRARLGLIATLLALAAVAWWATADRMRGMDDGPGSDLGALGWFLGVWAVMMAAMMLPAVAPTVALYAQLSRRRTRAAPFVFATGYLVIWTAAGLVAYGIFELGGRVDELAWDGAGRWLAGGTVAFAAAYELTPLKDACLSRCRNPLGFLMGAWRDGPAGAIAIGARHGAWCIACCWPLMASLFALGVMSVGWMAFVAALVALERIVPWGRAATYGTAALLLILAVALLADPAAIPGLTIPGDDAMGG